MVHLNYGNERKTSSIFICLQAGNLSVNMYKSALSLGSLYLKKKKTIVYKVAKISKYCQNTQGIQFCKMLLCFAVTLTCKNISLFQASLKNPKTVVTNIVS